MNTRTKGPSIVAYVKPENRAWVRRKAFEMDRSISYVVDRCMEVQRRGIPFKLEKKNTTYLRTHR